MTALGWKRVPTKKTAPEETFTTQKSGRSGLSGIKNIPDQLF
jgi:hypothetical protein